MPRQRAACFLYEVEPARWIATSGRDGKSKCGSAVISSIEVGELDPPHAGHLSRAGFVGNK